jgi:hypothetical protein
VYRRHDLNGGPRLARGTAAAIVVAVGFAVQATAVAQPQAAPARVIDRTMLCSTLPIGGGLYQFEVRAQRGVRENRTTWKWLAFAGVRVGHITRGPAQLEDSLVWAGAGRASQRTNLEELDPAWPYPAKTHGTLALNQESCRASSARVPLTARGLDGGLADAFGDAYDCAAPRRVLVRLRATLAARAPVYRERRFLKTKATVTSAYLAIRTPAGRRLAFAAVFQSGKARLFTATSCVPD